MIFMFGEIPDETETALPAGAGVAAGAGLNIELKMLVSNCVALVDDGGVACCVVNVWSAVA